MPSPNQTPALVWLRQDLRLSDNPALHAAIESKRPLALVFILDEDTPGQWKLGGASRWWLHHSLAALGQAVAKLGAPLVLRRGNASVVLPSLAAELGASALYWNRCYEPYAITRDTDLKERLAQSGIEVTSHNGALLCEPWSVKTKTGEPYKVYSPFWRACLAMPTRTLLPAPRRLNGYKGALASEDLESWELLPTKPNWAAGFDAAWSPGEAGAHQALERFLEGALCAYADARDQLHGAGTSRLSPHLHFGEISPVQVRAALDGALVGDDKLQRHGEKFLSELGWREFSTNLLFHWPDLPTRNWRAAFNDFPWRDDPKALRAWQRGRTGYPVVDAAMRELWATGYMHNRARMIAASFLVKHLLIDWRRGEEWFWDTLVDADLANNAASWQWVAGSGADAAPYFRIFNPVTQGERFDAGGAYVRKWVPELADLPDSCLHKPWTASNAVLAAAGITLGKTYPLPIVDHDLARRRALDAFAALPKA